MANPCGYLDWYEDPPDPIDCSGWFIDDDDMTDEERQSYFEDDPSLTVSERNSLMHCQ